MEGRRVNHSAAKRNPLYVLFLCLIAAVFVLLVVVIVLSARLSATQKALDSAKAQIEVLQKSVSQGTQAETPSGSQGSDPDPVAPTPDPDPVPTPDPDPLTPDPTPDPDPEPEPEPTTERVMVGWLDLTGHSEVMVKPNGVYDKYYTYYAAEAVNLRAGPSTNYTRILTIEKGAVVQAAAKENGWSFVQIGSKFGWVKTQYLSTTPPIEATSGNLTTP